MINNYLERQIKENFPYQPTPEQEIAIKSLSDFLLAPRSETVFLLRGYAGTGKTSLVGALVRTLDKLQQKSVLLAPTGRAAKVFSAYAGHPAFTIHKKIYRQQSFSNETGNYAEVKKWGLENFKRDTMWVAVLDTIFPKGFNADSMRYVPFGNGAQFEMAIKNDTAKSGAPFCLLEVKTPYEVYLNGLDKQEIANLKDVQTKLGKYSGLMIGSLETANNNAGNWE